MEADKLRIDNIDEDELNPYHEMITNKVEKGEYNCITKGTMVNTQ